MDRPIAADPADEGSFRRRCDVMDRKLAVAVVVGVLAVSLMCMVVRADPGTWEWETSNWSQTPPSTTSDYDDNVEGSHGYYVTYDCSSAKVQSSSNIGGGDGEESFEGWLGHQAGHLSWTAKRKWVGMIPMTGRQARRSRSSTATGLSAQSLLSAPRVTARTHSPRLALPTLS